MSGLAIWTASFMLAVDIGWQPYPDGGLEYIIQIEPHMLESLKAGEDIQSVIPPNLGRVRAFRITVGSDFVPRETVPDNEFTSEAAAPSPPTFEPNPSSQVSPFGNDDFQPNPADSTDDAPGLPPLKLPPPTDWDSQGDSPFGPFGVRNGAAEPSLSSGPRSFSDPLTTRASDVGQTKSEPPAFTFSSEDPGEDRGSTEPPKRLPNHSQQAVYIEEEGPTPNTMLKPELTGDVELEGDKPWLPFTLALAGLFGSLGGMLYFGWVAWDYRVRYRTLLERLIQTGRDYESAGSSPGLHGRPRDGDEI
jgi:hypothetical protein